MCPGGAVVLSSAAALSLEGADATTSGPGEVLYSRNHSLNLQLRCSVIPWFRNGYVKRVGSPCPHQSNTPHHHILPLRAIYRKLSRAMKVLRCSSPSVFGVESADIISSKEWGPAKESMGQATRRVLPTDQVGGFYILTGCFWFCVALNTTSLVLSGRDTWILK